MKNIREANMKELKEKAARHKKQWNYKLDILSECVAVHEERVRHNFDVLSERVAKLESVHRAAEKDRQSVPLQKSIKEMEQIQKSIKEMEQMQQHVESEKQQIDAYRDIANTLHPFKPEDRVAIINKVTDWFNAR